MRRTISLLVLLLAAFTAYGQRSSLDIDEGNARLTVDGRPYLILGGELGNSSASCPEDIEANMAKVARMADMIPVVPPLAKESISV